MKTPITYYGGKQRLLKYILPLIPIHTLYAEPFTGGGAVFFAKEPSEVEVINDTNKSLITFYRIAQTQFRKLQKRIRGTIHSRASHEQATVIYNYPELFSELDIAWAVWMLSASSFASKLDGSYGYDKAQSTTSMKIRNKKTMFVRELSERLECVQIEMQDACYIINSRDTPQSFFYCDPPYFNSHMGHYKGYTEDDFNRLLQTLSTIQGKFLLSSYPSEILEKYIQKNNWHTKTITQTKSIGQRSSKTEVLTSNYPIE